MKKALVLLGMLCIPLAHIAQAEWPDERSVYCAARDIGQPAAWTENVNPRLAHRDIAAWLVTTSGVPRVAFWPTNFVERNDAFPGHDEAAGRRWVDNWEPTEAARFFVGLTLANGSGSHDLAAVATLDYEDGSMVNWPVGRYRYASMKLPRERFNHGLAIRATIDNNNHVYGTLLVEVAETTNRIRVKASPTGGYTVNLLVYDRDTGMLYKWMSRGPSDELNSPNVIPKTSYQHHRREVDWHVQRLADLHACSD